MKKNALKKRSSAPATSGRNRLSRLFKKPLWDPALWNWESLASSFTLSSFPTLDISETDRDIAIKANIPGYEAKDIEVEVDQNHLIIRGKSQREKEEKGRHFLRRERSYGAFERHCTLPQNADTDHMKCESKDGILTIKMPKRSPETKRLDVQKRK